MHDARVLANSAIYRRCNHSELLQGQTICVNGHSIPVFFVGDSAYPLLPWLIKPFASSSSITAQRKTFNYGICRERVVVEVAFGHLKARWRRLIKQNDMLVQNVPNVIAACCTLDNICEIYDDAFNEEWLEDMESEDNSDGGQQTTTNGRNTNHNADDIRAALIDYFLQHPL